MGERFGTTIDIDDPNFGVLEDDARILEQAVEMRLDTAEGTYFEEPLYGLDVQGLLGDGVNPATSPRLGARVAAEVSEDERIDSAIVDLDALVTNGARFAVRVEPSEGEMELTGTIDEVREALRRRDVLEGG